MIDPRCPAVDELRGYLKGDLSPDRAREVDAHVLGCGPCDRVLIGLTDDSLFGQAVRPRGAGPGPVRPVAPAPTAPRVPPSVPDYPVVGAGEAEPSGGGFGVVWRARDLKLGRDVALKEIKSDPGDEGLRARFEREARLNGRLEHRGIVPVHNLVYDGRGVPYYVMRYIEGEDFGDTVARYHRSHGSSWFRSHDPEFRELIRNLGDICDVIGYAHSRGVLHRDLKPANVRVGTFGEVFVIDWGLAKPFGPQEADAEADAGRPDTSGTSGVCGTLRYVSPERLDGGSPGGTAVDIYSLGTILYEILTGRPAFGGPGVSDERTARDILAGRFPRPRQVALGVPWALEAVCLKAMSLEPAARYHSATELAADLDRWLDDVPIQARPEPWPLRARRTAARSVGLIGVALSLAVFASLVALYAGDLQSRKRAIEVAALRHRVAGLEVEVEVNRAVEAGRVLEESKRALERARRDKAVAEALGPPAGGDAYGPRPTEPGPYDVPAPHRVPERTPPPATVDDPEMLRALDDPFEAEGRQHDRERLARRLEGQTADVVRGELKTALADGRITREELTKSPEFRPLREDPRYRAVFDDPEFRAAPLPDDPPPPRTGTPAEVPTPAP